jgi:hypothetical protein
MRFRCTHLGLQQSETLGGGSYEDIWNLVQSKTKDVFITLTIPSQYVMALLMNKVTC